MGNPTYMTVIATVIGAGFVSVVIGAGVHVVVSIFVVCGGDAFG